MGAFSIFKDKKKQSKPKTPSAAEYYTRLANRAKIGMFSVIIMLVAFCLFSYSFYPDELNIENFKYLIKTLSSSSLDDNANAAAGSNVAFDTDNTNRFAVLRGDIAVLSNTKLLVYDTTGRILQDTAVKNDIPRIHPLGKNMIIYDLGGKSLDIYNSFYKTYTIDFDYPVLGVVTAENESFAVISSAKNYQSAVFVYDKHYRVIYKHFFPTEHSTALAIDNEADRLLVLSHISENGDFLGSAALFNTSEEAPSANFKFVGELPLSCSFTENGGYMILTDKYMRFYDRNNETVKEVSVNGLLKCEYGDNYVALTFDNAGIADRKTTAVYNENGGKIFEATLKTPPEHCVIKENRLYMLCDGRLTVQDLISNTKLFDIGIKKESVYMELSGDNLFVFTYSDVTVYDKNTLAEAPPEENASETEVYE